MLIVTVHPKTKQPYTDISFGDELCPVGSSASEYHLDITAVNCPKKPKCKPCNTCIKYISGPRDQDCTCSKTPVVETEKNDQWILRYKPDSLDCDTMRFSWCDLLWDLSPMMYEAVLYRNCTPCGRFRINLRNGFRSGVDRTASDTCTPC